MWPVPLGVSSTSQTSSRRPSQKQPVWKHNPLLDDDDDDHEEDEAQAECESFNDEECSAGRISLRMHGEQRRVRVEPGTSIGDLLHALAPKDREGKTIPTYSIMHAQVDGQGRLRQWDPLEPEDLINPYILTPNEDQEMHSDQLPLNKHLQLVDRSAELCIFFNSYFRMLTGCPLMVLRLYGEAGETVSGLVARIKTSLGLPSSEDRFWLFANYRTHVDRLEPSVAIGELRQKDDFTNPHLFQFQMLPECEDTSLLGITRSGNLLLHSDKALRGAKKWFFYLQGTTLFYQPSKDQRTPRKRIDNLHLCKIVYRGSNPNHTLYRFDITLPSGETKIFSSPLKKRVERWVRELRKAHPSTEIADCIDMAEVIKQEQCRSISHPPAIDPRSISTTDLLEDGETKVTFDQRRAIETMEAHLEKIEMDAGLLQLNGIDPELGRKWAESVRILLLQAASVEATPRVSKQVVPRIYEVLCRLKRWVRTIEREEGVYDDDDDDDDEDPLEMIPEVVSECSDLTQSYRYCILGLTGTEEEAEEQAEDEEALELCEMMGKLKVTLDQPIFRDPKQAQQQRLKPKNPLSAAKKKRVRLPSLNRQHIDQRRPTRRQATEPEEAEPGIFKRVIRFLSTSPKRDPSIPRTVKHYMEEEEEEEKEPRSRNHSVQRGSASVRSVSQSRRSSIRSQSSHQQHFNHSAPNLSQGYVNAYQQHPYAEPVMPGRGQPEDAAQPSLSLSSFMSKVMGRQQHPQPAPMPPVQTGFGWQPNDLGPMAHDPRFQSLCREYAAMSSQTSLNYPQPPPQQQPQGGSLESELVDELCRNDRLVDLIIRRRLMARA